MAQPPALVSIDHAVTRGLLTVYGVVAPLLAAAFFVPPVLADVASGFLPGAFVLPFVVALMIIMWCGAWAAWSVLVPRWRLWAYARVDDIPALKRNAVAAGLIWPDGHVFERTEIASAAVRAELHRLEQQGGRRHSGAS